MGAAETLPSAPRLLVELDRLFRHPYLDVAEITSLLRQDPALVARIIGIANSTVYAREEPAASLEEAVACVGYEEVHRIVGAIAARQMSDERLMPYGIEGECLRQNALFVALIMEELAQSTDEDPRSCYTVGLLRALGRLALVRLAPLEPTRETFPLSGLAAVDVWERRHWGLTNCEVAEKVLVNWRLPHETVIAILHHYHPERRHNPIIHLLNLAAGAAEHRGFGLPGEESFWKFTPENFMKAGTESAHVQRHAEAAQRKLNRLLIATECAA